MSLFFVISYLTRGVPMVLPYSSTGNLSMKPTIQTIWFYVPKHVLRINIVITFEFLTLFVVLHISRNHHFIADEVAEQFTFLFLFLFEIFIDHQTYVVK